MRVFITILVLSGLSVFLGNCKGSKGASSDKLSHKFHVQLKDGIIGQTFLTKDESVIKTSIRPVSKSQNSYRFEAVIHEGFKKEYMKLWKAKDGVISISTAQTSSGTSMSGTNTGMSKTKPIKQ